LCQHIDDFKTGLIPPFRSSEGVLFRKGESAQGIAKVGTRFLQADDDVTSDGSFRRPFVVAGCHAGAPASFALARSHDRVCGCRFPCGRLVLRCAMPCGNLSGCHAKWRVFIDPGVDEILIFQNASRIFLGEQFTKL
jgi:hypothetical protein